MSKWEMVRLGDVCEKAGSNIAQKDLENCNGEYPIFGASGFIKNINFYKQEQQYIAIVKDGAGIGRTMFLPAKSSIIGTLQYIISNTSVNVKYLYYAIGNMNLRKYFSGATIPHIYFKDYCNEKLPLPPLEEQKKIATILDKASALIALRKQQIAKMDLLVKSRFVEMFGDPVTNPMGWEKVFLAVLFKVCSSKRVYQTELTNNGIPFFRVSNLVEKIDKGKTISDLFISENLYNDFHNKNLIPKENDILITTRGTLGKCYIMKVADEFYFQDGMISWLIKNKNDINNIYLINLFETEDIKKQIITVSKGATVDFLSLEKLKKIKILCPPLPLQEKFADFVNQVETQKATLQKGLNMLELQYKTLMQGYFEG